MAPLTLHEVTASQFEKGLSSMISILKKASEASDASSFPEARLCEDMRPLTFQVQTASNIVKKTMWRLTGDASMEAGWPDEEKTLQECVARAERTLELVKSVTPDKINGREDTKVECQLGPSLPAIQMSAKEYALNYSIPNFFFHLTTLYAILRSRNLPLGKADYLGTYMGPFIAQAQAQQKGQ